MNEAAATAAVPVEGVAPVAAVAPVPPKASPKGPAKTAATPKAAKPVKPPAARKKPAVPRAKKTPTATTDQPKKVPAKKKAPTPRARKGKQAAPAAAVAPVTAPAADAKPTSDGAATSSAPEMELRQQYLHQLFNLLQQAHPGQDVNALVQYASTMEVEHFQKFPNRNEYANALNGELGRLSELARSTAAKAAADANQSAQNAGEPGRSSGPTTDRSASTTSPFDASRDHPREGASAPANGQYQQQAVENAQGQRAQQYHAYAGAQAGPGRQSNAPGQSESGAGMNGLAYMQSQRQSALPMASQGFEQQRYQAAQYYATSQAMQQQQQQYQQQASQFTQQPSREDFVNQLQQYDKNSLIDFVLNQKTALEKWQSRVTDLEMQVAALQNTLNAGYQQRATYDAMAGRRTPEYQQSAVPPPNTQDQHGANGFARGYAQQAQEQPPAPVRQTLNEETLRAHDASMGVLNGSPEQYWRRVGVMRSMYLRDLTIAHHALENHHAPPNSAQSHKADNLKHNVSLALNVLHEAPQAAEPRSFEVLDSIERFMQNTVKPIVDRIQSRSAVLATSAGGSGNQAAAAQAASYQAGYPADGRASFIQQQQQQEQERQQQQPKQPPRAFSQQSQPADGRVQSSMMPPMGRLIPPPRDFPPPGAPASNGGQVDGKLTDPGRFLNGQESPFGEFGAAKMSVPTFSPSERRTASAAQAPKDDNAKHADGYEGAEDDMSAFDELADMQFDDDAARKPAHSSADNSSSGSDKMPAANV